MTPDEQKRLAIVETKVDTMETAVIRIEAKLDALIAQANMGRGALWVFMTIGGAVVAFATWVVNNIRISG